MPLIAYVAWRFGRRVAPISRAVQARKGDLTDAANEAVVGIEMVQAFGREEIIQKRFADRATAIRDEMIHQAQVEAIYLPPVFYLPSLSVAVVLLLGGRAGDRRVDDLRPVGAVHPTAASDRVAVGSDGADPRSRSAGARLRWTRVRVAGGDPAAARSAGRQRRLAAGRCPSEVTFDDVHFSYNGGSEVLRGVRLQVAPDEIVAVCGRTGSWQVDAAVIAGRATTTRRRVLCMLGGIDSRLLPLTQLRAAVAIVTQRPVLFSETLRANLLAGRPDADEPAITRALELAGLAGFIDSCRTGWRR